MLSAGNSEPLRVGIDVRYLSHGILGGVHSYVACLVPALIGAAPDYEFFLYADTKAQFELSDLSGNVTVRTLGYRNKLSSFYNDLFRLRQAMSADHLDIAHFPANYGFGPDSARTVITLHDHVNVLPLLEIIRGHRKNLSTLAMMSYLHYCSSYSVPRADLVITMSEYSRAEILKHVDFDPERLVVWTNGPSPEVHEITDRATLDDVRQRYELDKPFVIADGIKNPGVLVEAWKLLSPELRDQYDIVFFSRTPAPPQPVFEVVEAGFAKLLVRPADQELRALYSLAHALAFPSWYEGLGLPLLEAMICGTPVVASDRGSIPEVVGEAGLLCDVEDIPGFAQNLTQVLSDPDEHQRLKQLGYARAAKFTWDKTARAYLEFYQRVLQGSQPQQAVVEG